MFAKTLHPELAGRDRGEASVRGRTTPTCAASVPADRLIDYRPGDGWEPICEKLGLPVPAEPFPHVNTTDEFRAMVGMEPLS